MNERCTATRVDGLPCQANTLPGRDRCWAHAADTRAKASAARKAGGHGKSNAARAQKHMPKEVRDIVQVVEAAMGGVLQSRITPSQAHAVASLAGAWVRLHELGEMALEIKEIRERLESQQGRQGGRPWVG